MISSSEAEEIQTVQMRNPARTKRVQVTRATQDRHVVTTPGKRKTKANDTKEQGIGKWGKECFD
jgi:hypothetical protein